MSFCKRKLCDEEIEYILDFIDINKNIPLDISMAINDNIYNELKDQLCEIEIYPDIIENLKNEVKDQYFKSIITPGDNIGLTCAQSIGQEQTQKTLNSFHHAGMTEKTTTVGVPRFQELISATMRPKNVSSFIYFYTNNTDISELQSHIGYKIVGKLLGEVINDIEIISCYNHNNDSEYTMEMNIVFEEKKPTWYDIFYKLKGEIPSGDYYVRLKINLEILYRYKLPLQYICEKIEESYNDVKCIFSPNNMGIIDIYPSFDNNTIDEYNSYITEDNCNYIYIMHCIIPTLKNIQITGISGITEIFYVKDNEEWYIDTYGSNLVGIYNLPIVNPYKTYCDNMWEIYNIFGIEAVREFLIKEFSDIMEGINMCHILLLVDRMTYTGTICSISRYTMKKEDLGPFAKASFEESMGNFLNSAAQADVEETNGIAASILCGKRIQSGTGMIDIVVDTKKLFDDYYKDDIV